MAKKKEQTTETPQLTQAEREVLLRAVSRVDKGMKAVDEDFKESLEDLKMCNNEGHWDPVIEAKRQEAGRPCLVLNEFIPAIRDIKGEQAETKPYTTVKPGRGGATKEVAELLAGHLRYKKHDCKADDAYDNAFGHQVQGGFGYFRVIAEWEKHDPFDQTFKISPILNQFSVGFDPNAELWHKNDGEYMWLLSYFDKEEFERRWPGVTPQSFSSKNLTWYPNQNKFAVCEYFEKEHKKETIYQLSDGKVLKEKDIPEGMEKKIGSPVPDHPELTIRKKRTVDDFTIYRYLLCGHAVLEDKMEFPCDLWGVIPVWGDRIVIQGKVSNRSIIRFGRDGQRAFNLYESTKAEAISQVPKSPIKATNAMLEGYEQQWAGAAEGTYPFLYYNPDPMMPGASPERLFGLDPSYIGALVQSSAQSQESIRKAVGPNIQLNSGGAVPQVSGSALNRWQQEGDISTYIFFDNLQKAIEWGDLVCIRLMQRILDTQRAITIRKADGSTEDVIINESTIQPNPQTGLPENVIKNDLTKGEYGVETTLGPSYTAQKSELAAKMMEFARALPPQVVAGTAHILAGMLFDVSQGGQEAQGGALQEFVKQIKKILLKMGMLDPTDLKQDELKDFAPMLLMLRQKPMPPLMVAKLKVEVGKAASLFARAQKDLATAGHVKVENAMQIMEFVRMMGIAAMEPVTMPQQPQGQPRPGLPGQISNAPQGMIQ